MAPGQGNNSVLLSFFLPVVFENQWLVRDLLDVDIDGPSELTHDASDLNKLVIFTWGIISIASTVNKKDCCKRLLNLMREKIMCIYVVLHFLQNWRSQRFFFWTEIYHDVLSANLASFGKMRAEKWQNEKVLKYEHSRTHRYFC